MKTNFLLLVLILLLSILTGCTTTNSDALTFVKKIPDVQSFLEENPGAEARVIYLDADYVSANIEIIRKNCGEQMQIIPYYYATLVNENQIIEIYTDESASRVLCIFNQALYENENPEDGTEIMDGNDELTTGEDLNDLEISIDDLNDNADETGNDFADNNVDDSTDTDLENENNFGPEYNLEDQAFSDTVCSTMPNTAMHLVDEYIAVLIPSRLDSTLAETGERITFTKQDGFTDWGQYYNADTSNTEGRYFWKCWINGGPNNHLCIIPISAEINYGNGNTVTKTGAIRLAFSGPLEALKLKTTNTSTTQTNTDATITSDNNSTTQDEPVTSDSNGPQSAPYMGLPGPRSATTQSPSDSLIQTSTANFSEECPAEPSYGEGGPRMVVPQMGRSWIPISEQMPPNQCYGPKEAVPTFTKTDCAVIFDDPCPELREQTLCGKCDYTHTSLFTDADTRYYVHPEYKSNLGQCRYCNSNQSCGSNDNYGICGSVCVNTPIVPPPARNYYINCGQCTEGQPFAIDFPDRSIESWSACINNYNWCVDIGCGRILDNCR